MTAYSPGADSGSGPGIGGVSSVAIRHAVADDMAVVRELLSAADLPLDGVDEAFAHGVVGVVDGVVRGAAAIEPYGQAGLLRSVVVDREARGGGMGFALVAAAEALATSLDVRELFLLTDTAISWFARLGYRELDRAAAPAAISGSIEFTVSCADTSVLMHRRLPVGR